MPDLDSDRGYQLWEAIKSSVIPLGQPRGPGIKRADPLPPEPREIDLHGLTIQDAFENVMAFLDCSPYRRVLVITGKSGQICKEFPYWAEKHSRVRKIEPARDNGSFWVNLR